VASVGVVGVFLGASTSNEDVRFASSACARRRWAVARDVQGICAPWDSAPVSVGGVRLGGWYVACGGGGPKTPVPGPSSGYELAV
jgi:hypothetical protein